MHNDKEYLVTRDVFNWIILDDQIIVLLQENGSYFEDNLVVYTYVGIKYFMDIKTGEIKDKIITKLKMMMAWRDNFEYKTGYVI